MSGKIQDAEQLTRNWWRTKIIEMKPGVIRYYGYPIEELIGKVSLAQMIWLMTRGELPSKAQGELLDAALMSAVDHGPQAPSIAISRMAATCGIGHNSAMASAVSSRMRGRLARCRTTLIVSGSPVSPTAAAKARLRRCEPA